MEILDPGRSDPGRHRVAAGGLEALLDEVTGSPVDSAKE
jgi:hypothetical protein